MARGQALASSYTTDRLSQREFYDRLVTGMKDERSTFVAHWQEIADVLLPRRLRLQPSDRNKGDRRNQNIIDSTGSFSIRTLQSGMHAGLTSPARPWFQLTAPDPDLADAPRVKAWLHQVTQRMRTVFGQTNLYNALPTVYGDMGTFGTGCMAVVDDPEDLFVADTYPVGSYALTRDRKGLVATFTYEYETSILELIGEFGGEDGGPIQKGQAIDWTRFSRTVKDAWQRGNYFTVIPVTWVVHSNPDADARKLSRASLPYTSCYFEANASPREGEAFLREWGFEQCPIFAPRWDVTGRDSYGTNCPGMMALGDVKQLQVMSRKEGQAIEKMVNPPLIGPSSLRTQKVSLLPGDNTYDDAPSDRGLRPIHEVKPDLSAFMMSKQEVQYRIKQAFMVDLFLMMAQSDGVRGAQPLTAREVEERHEEKMLVLGPVLERMNRELLKPLIDRTYERMARRGLIPEPPEELVGVDLPVEYTSILAQAQKLVSVGALDRFVQTTMGIAQIAPDALDKVKVADVIDEYADALGVNPKLIRSDDEAAQIAQDRAKAQQQQMQAEQMVQGSQAAKNLGTTPMDGDTALSRMAQSLSGAAI